MARIRGALTKAGLLSTRCTACHRSSFSIEVAAIFGAAESEAFIDDPIRKVIQSVHCGVPELTLSNRANIDLSGILRLQALDFTLYLTLHLTLQAQAEESRKDLRLSSTWASVYAVTGIGMTWLGPGRKT